MQNEIEKKIVKLLKFIYGIMPAEQRQEYIRKSI